MTGHRRWSRAPCGTTEPLLLLRWIMGMDPRATGSDGAWETNDMGAEGRNRRGLRVVRACVLAGIAGWVALAGRPAAASTADPAITQFRVSAAPLIINSLITGPDAALWFTWTTGPGGVGIGRMSTSGDASTAPIPGPFDTNNSVGQITAGDGALWVPESHGGTSYISEWSTSMTLMHEFPVPGVGYGIAWGPDGALWFTGTTSTAVAGLPGGAIGRMTTSGAVTTYPLPAGGGGSNQAGQIIAGPDGALWFDIPGEASVGRITTAGNISVFPLAGTSGHYAGNVADESLTGASDGAVWMGASWTNGIQRLAADGVSTAYPVPGVAISLTAGPHGNLWFATEPFNGPPAYVGELTTAGVVIEQYPLPPPLADNRSQIMANALTAGPDGMIWLADSMGHGEIDRLDPSVAPPTPLVAIDPPNVGIGPGPTATPTASPTPASTPEPSPTASATPEPPTPSPSPPSHAAAVADSRPSASNGPNLGLILGSVAGAVLLAAGLGAGLMRRRRGATGRAGPVT